MAKTKTRAQLRRLRADVGRLGGLVKSPAKARAVRKNGKLGGRPRKPLPAELIISNVVLSDHAAHNRFADAAVWLAHYVKAS